MIVVPIRTNNGLNAREHWRARSARVKHERLSTQLAIGGSIKPQPPCVVTLTRVAPSNGLDDDNLPGALKAVRDQIAEWLGIDDRRRDLVLYSYRQRRGPWAVEIQWQED